MGFVSTEDGVEIFYKDWGTGNPIVFSHGWGRSADDWDSQMLFLLEHGYRVIAYDRRGDGRSSQTGGGRDMDHYADDLFAVVARLDLKSAIHVGYSTGGGEVVRYLARYGQSRAAAAVLIAAVPPNMTTDPAQFYHDLPAGPLRGFNRAGAKPLEDVYDATAAFSQADFTKDLKQVTIPTVVMRGENTKLLRNSQLISYPAFPHATPSTNAKTINADLLNFINSVWSRSHDEVSGLPVAARF
jgi:non-heme chloroperoxidase